jgi:hypothetical protein
VGRRPSLAVSTHTCRLRQAVCRSDRCRCDPRRGPSGDEAADYRWGTEILHKLVFNDPDNMEARNVQADAFEQMGYQVEGPQWRGIILAAARELREGIIPAHFSTVAQDMILGMPIDILFHYAAVQVIGTKPPMPTSGSTSLSPISTRRGARTFTTVY